jgi:hypothetical protein
VSEMQREILEALANHWELLRWRCNDGRYRWHMGDAEYDGRSVNGLRRRGLVAWSDTGYARDGLSRLVLTDLGRAALENRR